MTAAPDVVVAGANVVAISRSERAVVSWSVVAASSGEAAVVGSVTAPADEVVVCSAVVVASGFEAKSWALASRPMKTWANVIKRFAVVSYEFSE